MKGASQREELHRLKMKCDIYESRRLKAADSVMAHPFDHASLPAKHVPGHTSSRCLLRGPRRRGLLLKGCSPVSGNGNLRHYCDVGIETGLSPDEMTESADRARVE